MLHNKVFDIHGTLQNKDSQTFKSFSNFDPQNKILGLRLIQNEKSVHLKCRFSQCREIANESITINSPQKIGRCAQVMTLESSFIRNAKSHHQSRSNPPCTNFIQKWHLKPIFGFYLSNKTKNFIENCCGNESFQIMTPESSFIRNTNSHH